MSTQLRPEEPSLRQYPPSLLPSLQAIEFACPLCYGELEIPGDGAGYHCSSCDRAYLLHAGIPDFRVFADPFLSFNEDRDRTGIVLASLEHHDLRGLLEHYWSFSDVTPKALRTRFIRSAMLGEQRAKRILNTLEHGIFKEPVTARRVLEIGSGTGNFLAVAASRYDQVIGIDIGMRWLHLSRRRFMDNNLPIPPLVCCCAEYLPFPDNSFHLVVSSSTLEFAREPRRMLAECDRVLARKGALFLNTVNRYSIAKDPYSYLWGVGFLPRAWQARYVRWRRGASYENIRTLSLGELDRLGKGYFARGEFALPDADPAALRPFSTSIRAQARIYQRLKRLPLVRQLLKWIGPGWDVLFRKAEGRFS